MTTIYKGERGGGIRGGGEGIKGVGVGVGERVRGRGIRKQIEIVSKNVLE